MQLDEALIAAATPLISQLSLSGDQEAASIMIALCDRLAERGKEVSRMKSTTHNRGILSHLWWKTRHQSRKMKAAQQKLDCYRDSRWKRHMHDHNAMHEHQHWPP